MFWDAQGILFSDYHEKGRTINSKYYRALLVHLKKSPKNNGHKWRRKKVLFLQGTVHRVTSWSQWWQNYMNCTPNCFHTHTILQIWSPVTTGWLQTSKECSRERDLAPMKKWYLKLRHILRPKSNRSTKKASNWNQCITQGKTMLMNKVKFCLKVVVLLVRFGTNWVMC